MKELIVFLALMLTASCTQSIPKSNTIAGTEYDDLKTLLAAKGSDVYLLHSTQALDLEQAEKTNTCTLDVAKGGVVSFQIMFGTEDDYSYSLIPNNNADIQVKTFTIKKWQEWDDFLVPVEGKVSSSEKFWVRFTVSEDVKPGEYEYILRFQGESDMRLVHAIVRVHDVEIPEVPTMPGVFGINTDHIDTGGMSAKEKYEVYKQWSDFLIDFRISPFFAQEGTSSPYPIDDSRSIRYMSNKKLGYVCLPWQGDAASLQKLCDKCRTAGILSKSYFYLFDEPLSTTDYNKVFDQADKVHSAAADAKTMLACYFNPVDECAIKDVIEGINHFKDKIDIFCVNVYSYLDSEEKAAEVRDAVKSPSNLWTYTCWAQKPGFCLKNNTRIMTCAQMWRSWKEESEAFLFWVVNSYKIEENGALTRPASTPAGDGVLVIPGKYFGSNEPLCASLRLENWRESAIDVELLSMIEKVHGREKALGLLSMVYTAPLQQTTSSKDVIDFRKAMLETLEK